MEVPEFLQYFIQMGPVGYLVLFAMTLGESLVFSGIFVPGTVVLVLMGGLVSYDMYDFYSLAASGISGAIIGNAISYELGRLGRVHVERWSVFNGYLARAKAFFLRHRNKSVFLGRFVGPIRPFIPFIAGAFDMSRMHFYTSNIFSAILWSIWYLGLGYAFGIAWKKALLWSSTGIGIGVAVIIAGMLIYWYVRKRKRQAVPA